MRDSLDLLYSLGRPISPLYEMAMRLRAALFLRGLRKRYKMPVPVISVGNLTMGGTGKTPMVQYLAHLLREKGYKPAIVSRGYGGKSKSSINIVSNGKSILMDAKDAGDEPRFLAESLPETPILTGKKRVNPCRFTIENHGTDLIVLDDGFQHMSMERDLDIVLFNASTITKNMKVFPGGVLREPYSALSRANCLVITNVEEQHKDDIEIFTKNFKHESSQKPVFLSSYMPKCAMEKNSSKSISLNSLPSSLYGFCGIASPHRFQNSLTTKNIHLQGLTILRDHRPYTQKLIETIEKKALQHHCKALLTTEKDMVKLRSFTFSMPLFAIVMVSHIQKEFDTYVLAELAKHHPLPQPTPSPKR